MLRSNAKAEDERHRRHPKRRRLIILSYGSFWHEVAVPRLLKLGPLTATLPTLSAERRLTAAFKTRFREALNAHKWPTDDIE
jgi:hypothetical protein